MKKLIVIVAILLVGCSAVKPVVPVISPTIDETVNNTTGEKKKLASIEQFAYVVPGESNFRELSKVLLDVDYDNARGSITGMGLEAIFPTNHSNQIMFEITIDNVLIGIWHKIPSYDDWLESKKSTVTHSDRLPISSQSEIDNFFDTSQQNTQNTNPAYMEQFVHIIPGKSTLLDILDIVKKSSIGSWSIKTAEFGWRIEFPTENPLNTIIVDISSDYTVLCVAHRIKDIVNWINSR